MLSNQRDSFGFIWPHSAITFLGFFGHQHLHQILTLEFLYNYMQLITFVLMFCIYKQFRFAHAAHMHTINLSMQIVKLFGVLADKLGKSQVEGSIIISSINSCQERCYS